MKNYKEVSAQETFLEELASALSYTTIEGQALTCKENKRDGRMEFSLTKQENLSARRFQGWVECVSAETLIGIFGNNFETTDDGMMEAGKVKEWMDAQK